MSKCYIKLLKFFKLLNRKKYLKGLSFGVAAAVEHERIIENSEPGTLIDVGANAGQFSLLVRTIFPNVTIIAFEPLFKPSQKYRALFEGDSSTHLIAAAIGSQSTKKMMHVSNSIDSSSLLEISETQSEIFPGTHEVGLEEVRVGALSEFVEFPSLRRPIFMKIDVQGYEEEVLKGASSVLHEIDTIYIECSFVELYIGQALAPAIIDILRVKEFVLKGIFNASYDSKGSAVQADFLFERDINS